MVDQTTVKTVILREIIRICKRLGFRTKPRIKNQRTGVVKLAHVYRLHESKIWLKGYDNTAFTVLINVQEEHVTIHLSPFFPDTKQLPWSTLSLYTPPAKYHLSSSYRYNQADLFEKITADIESLKNTFSKHSQKENYGTL